MTAIFSINPRKEVKNITRFIKKTISSSGFSHVVIACSGGVDSTTAVFLAVRALGVQNVYTLVLPYGKFNQKGEEDAILALNDVGIPGANRVRIDIRPPVDTIARLVGLRSSQAQEERVRLGNLMARVRMMILFDQAKYRRALVLGTENRSEQLLGYYTRFGDEASDIEPTQHLYKTQIYTLARFLGVPKMIIDKAPTAGLWAGQTDESQFGFSYSEADPILFALYDQGKTITEVIALGFSKDLVVRIKRWIDQYAFKHELPYIYSSHNS